MLRGVLGVVAALAVVLVVSLLVNGQSSSHGCIYVTIPAATGAQQVSECGATARSTCLSTSTPGAYTEQAARSIESECRKAGLAVSR
jgi:hypothetical protein